jgi:hypothetical protein
VIDGVRHVGRVPPDDGGDHQVQARSAVLLSVAGPLGDPPLAEGADRLRQRVPLLAANRPSVGRYMIAKSVE